MKKMNKLQMVKFLWAYFVIFIVLLFGINCYLSSIRQTDQDLLSQSMDSLPSWIIPAFYLIGLILVFLCHYLPKISFQKTKGKPFAERYFAASIFRYALIEFLALLGFIINFLSGTYIKGLGFFLVALALYLNHFPSAKKIELAEINDKI